ncbi:MAG: hypothetical protein QNJ05_14045 [Woeseiaceae bacterium]|nr:hypothetical protein [Woeseiaceae bacterium]
MNLENVTVELRPRGEWEAAELGGRMVRRDAGTIYRVWFAMTLPAVALMALVTWFTNWGGLALLLYWWLEPITDGPILRIISRRLFGEEPDTRSNLKAVFSIAWRNKIYWLSPHRLHFARSTMMPVTQLEGLTGARRRARAKTLGARIFSHGVGVTAVYQHLVLALYVGMILLIFMLMPESVQQSWGQDWFSMFWDTRTKMTEISDLVIFYLAQSALHPWFVGAGFGLYINCRTQLEAWDIEVAFRRMLQRRAALKAAASLLIVIFLVPLPSFGQETEVADEMTHQIQGYWTDEELKAPLESVGKLEELDIFEEVDDWQRIEKPAKRERDFSGNAMEDFFEGLAQIVSVIVEFALWITVALLLLVIFLSRERWMPYLKPLDLKKKNAPRVILAGGEVRAEELPDDIPQSAMSLWKEGRRREALALLYRGTVYAAVTHYNVRLPKSATENMCVAAVARSTDREQTAFFRRVVSAWIRCAYASELVDEETVAGLCRDWPSHFKAVQQ